MAKPVKPTPDFPLTPHKNGQFCKKIGGKILYFGTDPDAALRKYNGMVEALKDLPAGSLRSAIDRYVASRRLRQESGRLSDRHVKDIDGTLASLAETIGPARPLAALQSEDYARWRARRAKGKKGKPLGPVALGGHVTRVRAFLNWAKREKLISDLPPEGLEKPSRRELRLARAARGSLMFEPAELQLLLKHADPRMRAMIYLGLNAGLNCEDIARLCTHHLQASSNGVFWFRYARNKTGIQREAPLWPETQAALEAVIREGDDVVFRTKYGNPWTIKNESGSGSPVSARFTKLCQNLGIHKPGRGFGSLRHNCETIGGEAGDQAAIDYIMGHSADSDDISAVYRERMKPSRLFKVVKHIRRWALRVKKPKPVSAVMAH